MKTEPEDIIRLSKWCARKFVNCDNVIDFEERTSIAIESMYKTLAYVTGDTKISSRIVIAGALSCLHRNIQKKRKELTNIDIDKPIDAGTNNIDTNDEVKNILKSIEEPARTIVIMRIWCGAEFSVIAKHVKKSASAVKTIYYDTLNNLRIRHSQNHFGLPQKFPQIKRRSR